MTVTTIPAPPTTQSSQNKPAAKVHHQAEEDMNTPQPLVLTLRLDKASEHLLTNLRTKHFPTHRNHLPSHVTLFHALPASQTSIYNNHLHQLTSTSKPFSLYLKKPFALGKKGVAINIASHKLRELHADLQHEFRKQGVHLTEQDERKLSPHVTVQNKVSEEVCKRTLDEVTSGWEDRPGTAEGLVLWRYEKGGTWTFLREFGFQA